MVSSCFRAIQSDRNLLCINHDPFDLLADELAVRDVIAGQSFLLIGSPRLPNCLADKGLDIGRRYGLQEGLRHIIPIPNALFVGMARAHRNAAIVEDQTHEDGGGIARVTASQNRRDNATLAVQRLRPSFHRDAND